MMIIEHTSGMKQVVETTLALDVTEHGKVLTMMNLLRRHVMQNKGLLILNTTQMKGSFRVMED